MKKLRLLFTQICNRRCEGCCNKDWELDKLEQVSHFNYDEILLTGGEPLLFTEQLIGYVKAIRILSPTPVIVRTSSFRASGKNAGSCDRSRPCCGLEQPCDNRPCN